MSTISARYDVDKRRWQEIKADQARAAAAGLEPPTKAAGQDRCQSLGDREVTASEAGTQHRRPRGSGDPT